MLTCAEALALPGVPPAHGAEWTARTPGLWTAARPLGEALQAGLAPAELAVAAYANEGRWVVMCPDCSGAQLAARDDRRFMCVECANVVVEGLWRPVVWPDDETAIETELERRPVIRTRNWEPGETVDDLATQYDTATTPPPPDEPVPPVEAPDPEET